MKEKKKNNNSLLFKLSLASFVSILTASGIFSGAYYILAYFAVEIDESWWTIIVAGVASIVIGIVLSIIVNMAFFNPIKDLLDVTDRVTKGDFSVQLKEHKKKNGELKSGEMATLTHSFNVMVHELDKNKTLKSDFVTNISHEFKTPLANIKGHAELIKNCQDIKKINEYCDNIIEASMSLTFLTSNILRLSKLENHSILQPNDFRLDEQIRQAIIFCEGKWSDKNINLNIDLDEITIFYDEGLFMQVWQNLISNAVKFTDEGGEINILLKKYDDEAVFTIKDNGIGMNDEVKSRIFDKFYQGDASHAKEGNGLGLALVKKILDISHCKVEVDSKEGEGTTFTVHIPI
ncbi:MAG: HAMP domain-containing sensor histidine kinase [Clostridia bacterium]|nr:HAMP domain-containing sensor histidine kinase [Clostridia bacterium]